MNLTALKTELSKPEYVGLSDADALALAATPVLTPRSGNITVTSLGAILGGSIAAAMYGMLLTQTQNADPQIAGFAIYAKAVLDGPGFDASNAEAATIAATLVGVGVATAEQANTIFNTTSYVTGETPPTLEDVTAIRPFVALGNLVSADYAMAQAAFNAAKEAFNAANSLNMSRLMKIGTIQQAGGMAPADLAALDAAVTP